MVRFADKHGGWQKVCEHKCGAVLWIPFNNGWFAKDDPCPRCGGDLYELHWPLPKDCQLYTARWRSTAKILRPSTWFGGYWQKKPEGK